MYDMDLRMYDPAIARWVVQDPVVHFDYSPYTTFDNNPVFWADPSGADAESFLIDLFERSESGENWTNSGNGSFTSSTGQTAECDDCNSGGDENMVVSELGDMGSNNDPDPPNKYKRIFQAMLNVGTVSSTSGGGLALTQEGMMAYRQTLSVESKIETFSRFRSTYSGLGIASRTLGRTGTGLGAIGLLADYNDMQTGNLSLTRFTYRASSFGISVGIGAGIGGPPGAAAGALVGTGMTAGEMLYDFWHNTLKPEINKSFNFSFSEVLKGFNMKR